MISRGLFIASSPKYYFWNPEWYKKWLGTVDHRYLFNEVKYTATGWRMVKWYPRAYIFELWFFSNLDLDWHSLLWISAHRHGIITIFITYHHHLSSTARNPTTFFNPREKVCCFAFSNCHGFVKFCWNSQSFGMDLSLCFRINFSIRISVLKAGMGTSS